MQRTLVELDLVSQQGQVRYARPRRVIRCLLRVSALNHQLEQHSGKDRAEQPQQEIRGENARLHQ